MTVWSAPPSSFTPSTTSLSVPMPWICAPILLSNRQRSWTCGSRAALKISVLPFARTAARRMFSVPVTVGRSKTMRSPRSRFASATISCSVSVMWAPICRSPRRCCSTRRAPMSSPPGRGTRASWKRPISAPSMRMVARMRRPSSSGTSADAAPAALISTDPSPLHVPPSALMISPITRVSVTFGTLLRRTGCDVSRAAAISGRAAFLEPLMQMPPASWLPPVILRARSAAARSRQPQARLRHRERGLELGLLGCRERALESLLGALSGLFRALDRDLVRVLGHVRQHGDAVGQHLEEPAADEQELLFPAVRDLQRPGLEDGHQRRVARQDAELAVRPVGDDEVHVALEEAALDAHDAKRNWHLGDPSKNALVHKRIEFARNSTRLHTNAGTEGAGDHWRFFISSPWARASSMVPTM